jgi:Sensors of blue-light using FAD
VLNSVSNIESIVYVSTAASNLSTEQLEDLLITARERNLERGVTGVLLFSGTQFMQCFEGSPESVRDVHARIMASTEHHDIRELMNGPVKQRGFSDWQMGFAQATKSELLTLWTANWERQALWAQGWKVPRGMELLQLFWSRAGPDVDPAPPTSGSLSP